MDIKENVKRYCKRNGTTFESLAESLGIGRGSLYSRLQNPKFSTLQEIADALCVPVAELLQEPAAPQTKEPRAICPHCGKSFILHLTKE